MESKANNDQIVITKLKRLNARVTELQTLVSDLRSELGKIKSSLSRQTKNLESKNKELRGAQKGLSKARRAEKSANNKLTKLNRSRQEFRREVRREFSKKLEEERLSHARTKKVIIKIANWEIGWDVGNERRIWKESW